MTPGVVQVLSKPGSSEASAQASRDGLPVFFAAGGAADGEFRCAECGYGAIVRTVLPTCPMCHGVVWEEPAGSPFGRRGR